VLCWSGDGADVGQVGVGLVVGRGVGVDDGAQDQPALFAGLTEHTARALGAGQTLLTLRVTLRAGLTALTGQTLRAGLTGQPRQALRTLLARATGRAG
jgi:hypothetical protein